jgi:hypothetical protein
LRDANNSLVTINPLPGNSYIGDLTNVISNTQTGSTPNGRDTSGAFGSDIWVYFYWIWDGTTLASLSSASYKTMGGAGATLPAGYTHWCLAAFIRLTAYILPTTGYMRGNTFFYDRRKDVVLSDTSTSEVTRDLATFIPPECLWWHGELEMGILNNVPANAQARYNLRLISGYNYLRPIVNTNAPTLSNYVSYHFMLPNVDQEVITIWTDNAGKTITADIYLQSYTIPNGG